MNVIKSFVAITSGQIHSNMCVLYVCTMLIVNDNLNISQLGVTLVAFDEKLIYSIYARKKKSAF